MRKTIRFGFFSLLVAFSGGVAAETGELVTLNESGPSIAETTVTVCLNALDLEHRLSCQDHIVRHATFAVDPVDEVETYSHMGVKVSPESGFTFETDGSGCTEGTDGFCLFVASHDHPATINASSTTIAIGQPYEGGIIADLIAEGGDFNLIASAEDNVVPGYNQGVPWSSVAAQVGGDGAIDSDNGLLNTINAYAMIFPNSSSFTQTSAIKVCHELDEGGFDNWYLPAINQLIRLQTNQQVIGGFQESEHYWSSTEVDDFNNNESAFIREFDNSNNLTAGKTGVSFGVRCVRTFTPPANA